MTTHSNVYSALAAVQQGMAGIRKDGRGNRSQYITLDHLLSVARPLCAQHGLCILHRLDSRDGLLWVGSGVGLIDFKDGAFSREIWIDVPIMPQDPGSKGSASFAPWALGSAQTYGRRYGLAALFAVSSLEDDDGGKAQQTAPKAKPIKSPSSDRQIAPTGDKGKRAAALGSIIKSAIALGHLPPDAPKVPHADNVDVLRSMVGEAVAGPGVQPKLTEVSTGELEQAAAHWRSERAAGEIPA